MKVPTQQSCGYAVAAVVRSHLKIYRALEPTSQCSGSWCLVLGAIFQEDDVIANVSLIGKTDNKELEVTWGDRFG